MTTNCDCVYCQENIEDEASTADKEPMTFGDGLLITTVTPATTVLFFGLRALGAGQ